MMTKQEAQLGILSGQGQSYGKPGPNDAEGRFVAYRDRTGTVHWMAYSDDESRKEAVKTIKNVMLSETEPDMERLHGRVKEQLGREGPGADERAARVMNAALKPFAEERRAADLAFAGSDLVERSDVPAATVEEKEAAVAKWVEKMVRTPEGARFALDKKDSEAVLKLLEQKVGITGAPAVRMMEMEAAKATGIGMDGNGAKTTVSGRRWGDDWRHVFSSEVRKAIEKDLAKETADSICEQKGMAQKAVEQTAAESASELQKSTAFRIQSMQLKNEREAGRRKPERHLDIESGALDALQKMKDRQLAAIEQKTSERLQKATMPSAAAERKANAAALANCFPGGMGKTAQEAVQAQNAQKEQNALEYVPGMGRRS